MRVLIRADASVTIGSGHIARCLTLANTLRNDGADVRFACRELPGHLLQRLADQGYVAHALPARYNAEEDQDIEAALPWQADLSALAEELEDEPPFDWLIVDHYGLDARWEKAARGLADRVMAIDDLANRPHGVEVLLDQNYSAQALDQPYAAWVGPECQTFLGPRFALLRDEFQCEAIAIKPRVERVLVNFGGFDAAGQVYATMLALQGFVDLQVDFVAGLHNPNWQAMSELTASRPEWRLHTLTGDFFALMQAADLFIGAGGGTTWERAALGLPTICMSVANNQQLNAQLLAEAGVHLYLGPHVQLEPGRLRDAIGQLCGDAVLRRSFAEQSRLLVDGRGARRIADALAAPANPGSPDTLTTGQGA
ncbi:UDP-2,4-diacetamido-2,4,6-trideoxy-beta-L-altropyranose hydrolase [Pseudomonas sp. NPDC078416]|uniref:UDP-2,4-diacetamido-2,4, 6-trideoxy-beta-L-altropyranose hydrolase n=1 Tax=Pseudomonas sp. NPDC078416 TaxID=3390637 RepID=UPI003D02EF35